LDSIWNASTYDAERRRLIPCFDEFYGVASELVVRFGADSPRILDLGAGRGILSAAIAECVPMAQFHLLQAMTMRLIRYQPEHKEPMLALHRSAIEGFVLGISQQQDEADLMSVEEVYLHSRGEFLLGFIGERLVAMGGFKRMSEGSAELRRMRIAGDLQGQGCGTLMLLELERRAFQSGIRTLCLETAERRPLTLKFYRKHGYRETGRGFYGAVETIQFSKTLD